MNKNPLEKQIEKTVCSYARTRGCLVYKFVSPAQSHVPDRIIIFPNGRIVFIEFKRLGCKPTAAQEIEHEKMRKNGVMLYVVDDMLKGKATVDFEFAKDALLKGPRFFQ